MGVLFLIANLVCLAVLVRQRYWKLYPWFIVAQSLTCVQAGSRMFVALDDRAAWMHIWAPGESALLCATGVALLEAVWRAVEQMPHKPRWRVFLGLIAFSASLAFAVHTDRPGDWYAQFVNHRTWLYLCYAILAFAGFWIGIATYQIWPRVARMHMTLYAVLMVGHVSFGSGEFWMWANSHYRWLEILCCAGWVINSGFLSRELEEAQRSLDEFRRRKHASDLRIASTRPSILPGDRTVPQVR